MINQCFDLMYAEYILFKTFTNYPQTSWQEEKYNFNQLNLYSPGKWGASMCNEQWYVCQFQKIPNITATKRPLGLSLCWNSDKFYSSFFSRTVNGKPKWKLTFGSQFQTHQRNKTHASIMSYITMRCSAQFVTQIRLWQKTLKCK